ncbi:hypothetical protein CFP66_46320 [Pseudonocardia sp. MH-G8]|nr:hypothetical protein CFP66_46320 [Pseudonocardia sp. MH-G8]
MVERAEQMHRPPLARAPGADLPSSAIARAGPPVLVGLVGPVTRRASHPLTAVSSSSGSTRCRTRRIVASLGVRRPVPSRSRTETGRS